MSGIVMPEKFYAGYLFDLDGTIYLGDHLLPGVARLIGELRRRSVPVRFLTNNPTRTPREYSDKLNRLGIPTSVSEVVNSVGALIRWITRHHPGATVFPIAERPVVAALESAGIPMSEDPAQIDVVVASYDRSFDYRKLQIAFDAIWYHRRAILVGTNPDRYCPLPGGRGEPDCAAVIAAIEACTGTTCAAVVGKPDPEMVSEALAGVDLDPRSCVMVGDRLSTDVALAVNAGMASALVLTGDSVLTDVRQVVADERPTYVLDRIDRLVPSPVWRELGWSESSEKDDEKLGVGSI